MKICFLSSMHLPDDKRVHVKEACSLKQAGFDVVHICPGESDADPSAVLYLDGVAIRQYPSQKGLIGRLRQLRLLYRLARDEKADAYHCNEVDSWLVGVILKIRHKKICVFDVHEHYPSTFAQSRFPKYAQPAVAAGVRAAFRLLLPFTDRLVLAKRTVADDFPCKSEKKILVRNFSLTSSLQIAESRVPRMTDERMTIVHLGVFGINRGWPQVLDALALVDARIRLKVVGTINDGTASKFHDRVQELNLQDRVECYDWMPFDDAFSVLVRGHVGIIAFQPNIANNVFAMPHKLFDYMAAGMSVLLPKQAIEVVPVVEETNCGLLIDPSDPKDIALAISHLYRNPISSEEMGQRGQAAVRYSYNWEVEARRLIDMYVSLSKGLTRQ